MRIASMENRERCEENFGRPGSQALYIMKRAQLSISLQGFVSVLPDDVHHIVKVSIQSINQARKFVGKWLSTLLCLLLLPLRFTRSPASRTNETSDRAEQSRAGWGHRSEAQEWRNPGAHLRPLTLHRSGSLGGVRMCGRPTFRAERAPIPRISKIFLEEMTSAFLLCLAHSSTRKAKNFTKALTDLLVDQR